MLQPLLAMEFDPINGGQLIGIVAVGGAMLYAIVGTIASNARKTSNTRDIEQSRREIAAYVAEGSMTPEQAERLLAAGPAAKKDSCC